MRLLLTGANSFIGTHLVREVLKRSDWEIVSLERLKPTTDTDKTERVTKFYHDFRAAIQDDLLREIGKVDFIIHAGAEVMASRSMAEPRKFVQSNAVGVFNMLEVARKLKVKKFLYTSSSEVFGSSKEGTSHGEDDALNPSNPYSAAKAAGEMLCRSYHKSFEVPVNIVRTVNIFGPNQDATRFISMAVHKLLAGETLTIYAGQIEHSAILPDIGSRQWIYIADYVDALLFLLQHGKIGEAYNISGEEHNNFEIMKRIASLLGIEPKVEFVEVSPTYDLHCRISDSKLRTLGWNPATTFDERLKDTVQRLATSVRTSDASIS